MNSVSKPATVVVPGEHIRWSQRQELYIPPDAKIFERLKSRPGSHATVIVVVVGTVTIKGGRSTWERRSIRRAGKMKVCSASVSTRRTSNSKLLCVSTQLRKHLSAMLVSRSNEQLPHCRLSEFGPVICQFCAGRLRAF